MSDFKKRVLYYDIETSYCEGHFWRPGYNQTIHPGQIIENGKIICISWKWLGDDKIHNAHWGLNKQCDKKLLKKFIKELNKAHEIVAHNGKRFDIKWIRTRAMYHGLDMLPHYNEIDTLAWCKKYINLPSNKLAEVAKYFGLTAKLDPGGLSTWVDIIRHKKREALDRMIEYCDGDIITLEAVYHKFLPYVKPQTNYAVLNGSEKWNCPSCGSNHVIRNAAPYTSASGVYKAYMRCNKCNTPYQLNKTNYEKYKIFRAENPSGKGKNFD